MPRREVILRDDGDGGKRRHEVELRTWKVTAPDGRSITFESDSWFAARQRGRMEFVTENVKAEEVEETVLFTDGKGEPLVMTPASPEELRRSEEIMAENGPVAPDVTKALESIDQGAKGVVFNRVLSQKEIWTVMNHLSKKYDIPIEPAAPTPPSADIPPLAVTAIERLKNRAKGK